MSMIVVGIDVFIMIIFMIAIFRLRWYEELTVQDMKAASLRIDDFSVLLTAIPIPSAK